MSGTVDAVTLVTPGRAASSSSTRSKSARDALGRIAVQLRRDREGDHVLGADAKVDAADIDETADEQAGRNQQRHRERNLRGRQRHAEPRRGLAPRPSARRVPSASSPDRARAVQSGKQPEEQPRAQRQHPRTTAWRCRSSVKSIVAAASSGSSDAMQVQRPARHEQAERGAEHRQHQRLAQKLRRPVAGGWRQSTAAPPSRRRGRRPARAAGWRCSHKQSAARIP